MPTRLIKFSSSDTNVIKIENKIIKGISEGTATIIATYQGKTDTTILNVIEVINSPPSFISPSTSEREKTIEVGQILNFEVKDEDNDGDKLKYTASGLVQGMYFNTQTNQFTCTPKSGQERIYNIEFTVTDNKGGSDSETITINVMSKQDQPPKPQTPTILSESKEKGQRCGEDAAQNNIIACSLDGKTLFDCNYIYRLGYIWETRENCYPNVCEECQFLFEEPNLEKITISPSKSKIDINSQKVYYITAYYSNNNQETVTSKSMFSSSDTDVAIITSNKATGISEGTAKITATYQGKTTTAKLTVNPPQTPTIFPITKEYGDRCGEDAAQNNIIACSLDGKTLFDCNYIYRLGYIWETRENCYPNVCEECINILNNQEPLSSGTLQESKQEIRTLSNRVEGNGCHDWERGMGTCHNEYLGIKCNNNEKWVNIYCGENSVCEVDEYGFIECESKSKCSDCGRGIWNRCDRIECSNLGNCIFTTGFAGIGTTCEERYA